MIVPFQIERGIAYALPVAGRVSTRPVPVSFRASTRTGDTPAMTSFDEQLNKYLTDAHSIEKQALAQLKAAPKMAGDPAIESAFAEHLTETEGHERLVRARLQERDSSPSLLMKVPARPYRPRARLHRQRSPAACPPPGCGRRPAQ